MFTFSELIELTCLRSFISFYETIRKRIKNKTGNVSVTELYSIINPQLIDLPLHVSHS